jgi:hypothetical protein
MENFSIAGISPLYFLFWRNFMYKSHTQISSFKSWMKRKFDRGQLKDMVSYGVRGGFPHLTYYSDTTALYRKYHEDIWEMLSDDANNMGHQHPLELIATFGGAANVVNCMTFENLLVWYAAERVASELTDI